MQIPQQQLDANLAKNLDICIARIMMPPEKRKYPLTQKQVHVGLEAMIYKADHLAATQGLKLERAACILEYKDKEGKKHVVSADINMNAMKGKHNEKENRN